MSTPICLHTLELSLWERFLPAASADDLYARILGATPWSQHRIRLFGREVPSPRLSAWVADPGCDYTYSRARFEPLAWTPELSDLRRDLNAALGTGFNSVLCNLYRDGGDSMGWHSDDEPELGPDPLIASLSLGARRRFVLRSRKDAGHRIELELGHGSLLLMRGATQAHWQHALPRALRVKQPRINLTFRTIVSPR